MNTRIVDSNRSVMIDSALTTETPLLLKTVEAAKKLSISKRYLEELISRGDLPVVRFGRRAVRIRPSDLTALTERKVK